MCQIINVTVALTPVSYWHTHTHLLVYKLIVHVLIKFASHFYVVDLFVASIVVNVLG